MSAVRLKIFPKTADSAIPSHRGITKLMALPTANKKDGNTKSVGVNPCQAACCKGAKVGSPPGVFTIIIKQMVIPLNTSRERNLLELLIGQFCSYQYTQFIKTDYSGLFELGLIKLKSNNKTAKPASAK